ncbi:putative ribonuclease H protein, partial [Mucuna pruriens]
MLSKSICTIIGKKFKSFIWEDTDQFIKIHVTSWSSICSPKSYGGLGLRKMDTINQAYIMKLGYRRECFFLPWNLKARC